MENSFKRFLSLVVAIVMVIGMVPMNAFATESTGEVIVIDDDTTENAQTTGDDVSTPTDTDFTNATADESGAGWAWANDTKTLTLNGASITEAVVLPAGSTIVVAEGTENSIVVASGDAVSSDGALAISGNGKLKVVADGEASAVVAPSVSITDTVVDLHGYFYGIQAKTTTGTADSVVTLTNVSGKIVGYRYGGINAHSETANVTVKLTGCHDLVINNEVNNDSTSVNFYYAGIRAYTRGNGKDVLVELNGCKDVSISNSTMAILAANNAHAANAEAANVNVLIKDSTGIELTGNTSCYSAVFVNNYGVETDDSSNLVIENSKLEVNAPNASGLMTSTKSAPSKVDITGSELTISAGLTGIRTIASSAEYADTDVTGSEITFEGDLKGNPVDESAGGVAADEDYADDASKITVVKPATTYEVGTKAELDAAIAAAQDGDTIKMTAAVDYTGTATPEINAAITLDLGGYTLTTHGTYGGLRLKGGCSIKNGTLAHQGTVTAIKAWDVEAIEDLVIDVAFKAEGKVIGGIVIQENAAGIGSVKNVTIKGEGLTNGIETYNRGNAQVIDTMENVTIDAVGTGMLLSAPCGTATNCTIKGGVSGIDMLLKGTYSVSIDLVNCTVEGGEQAVYAHDEQKGYTYVGSIKLTADEDTDFVNANGVYLKEAIAETTTAEIDDVRDYKVTYIGTVAELVAFAAAVNAGNTFKGETVKLTADIDLSSVANWTPIGNSTNYFCGIFDGQGHTISNMTINVNNPDANQFVGFFGGVRKTTIKNFKLTNVNIDVVGKQVRAAAVVAIAHSNSENHTTANLNLENITVDGCVINAEAKASSVAVGGLAGYCYPANMTNISVSNLTINPKASTTVFAGGLVGYMQGQNISNNGNTRAYFTVDTFNLNNITIKSESADVLAGGFAGYTYYRYITLKNATINGFKVDVDVTAEALVGGLIGLAHRSDKGHTFTEVAITGIDFDITSDSGKDVIAGGMVGYSGSPIAYADCSVSGTITETCRNDTSSAIAGGFVGGTVSWTQSFEDCTADVDIKASNIAGGFVGHNGVTATYTDCEAKGSVEAPTAGGFAASTDKATYINCSYTGESDVPFIPGYVAQVGTTYYKTLAEAITAANAVEGGATVTLLDNVTLGEKLTISGNVTISGAYTITRADAYTGTLFTVNAGATLTLDGGLVIDGGNAWTYTKTPLEMDMENGPGTYVGNHITPAEGGVNATEHLIANNGTLNANKVTIQNSYSTNGVSAINCGASSVTTLNGATIQNVAANRSGAIVNVGGNDAVLTIKGDTRITGNFGIGNGGIIQNYGQGTTVNLEGGSIDNNHVGKSGTLYASYSDNANKINTFNMSGGIITKNIMEGYGPVYIHTNTVWNMTGGEISYNTSLIPSYVRNNNPAGSMTGGKIVNNTAVYAGYENTQDLRLNGKTAITGGTFTQDVSAWLAPDTGLVYDEATGTYGTTDHVYNLWFIDPTTGEQGTVGPLQGNDPASLIATGNLFYADYYIMELEVLSNAKIDETIVIDYPMTINLNGYTISATSALSSTPVFRILSEVTVIGKGKVDGRPGESCYAFIVGNSTTPGKLTIENGTFYGDTTVASVTKGTLSINGGNFAATEYEGAYEFTLNCIDANYKTGDAKIVVNGGVFYKFNPANNAAEGASTNFVAKGYKAEADGNYYKVVNAAVKVTVTVNNATMVEGNARPEFTYTTDVAGVPALNITYTVDGTTINATVAEMEGYEFTVVPGTLTVEKCIATVDGTAYSDWNEAKAAIKGDSVIVLHDNIENPAGFSYGAANKTLTLDLNGHSFTTKNIGQDGHKTLHITDSATGGSVTVTDYVGLYANGYLNVDSDVDFNAKLQINYHSAGSTGCFMVDGVKLFGRGHFQQADGIFGTTGGSVTIKNNFKEITINSGNFTLNKNYEITAEQFVVNKDATVTVSEGAVLALNAASNVTINGTVKGNGKVVVNTIDQFKTILGTDIVNIELGSAMTLADELKIDEKVFVTGMAKLTVTGKLILSAGTYDQDVNQYCADDHTAVDNSDGTWTVKEIVIITLRDQTMVFGNLVDTTNWTWSHDNATAIDGLTVTFSVKEDITAPGTYTITATATDPSGEYAYTIVNAVLTVKAAVCAIGDVNYASLADAVKSVPEGAEETTIKLLVAELKISHQMVGHQYAQKIVIDLNGGKLYSTDKTLTAFRSGTVLTLQNGTVSGNTTGGTLVATYGGTLVLGEDLKVTSGGQANAIRVDQGTLVINSNVEVVGGKNWLIVTDKASNKVTISSGDFTGGMEIGASAGMQLSGGWYDVEIKPEWCVDPAAPKYYAAINRWTVAAGNITVDGVWFDSWDDAESSIKKNAHIVLYADVENYYGGTVAKDFKFPANGGNITLDLNGHTFMSAKSATSAVTSISVQYNTVLNIIGEGNFVIENNSYPFVINPKATVKMAESVNFVGTIQWNGNGNSGNLYIGETALIGVDGVFKPEKATRIVMTETGDWTVSMGSLTMTADDATLADNTLTISKNCALNLNGHNLTAKNVSGFGTIIDSTDGSTDGVGSIVTEKLWFNGHDNGGYMPLKDGNCYRLFAVILDNRGYQVNPSNPNQIKVGFTVRFNNVEAYDLLIASVEAVKLSAYSSDQTEARVFTASDVCIHLKKARDQLDVNGTVKNAITGINTLDDSVPSVTVYAELRSETGVVIKSSAFIYEK